METITFAKKYWLIQLFVLHIIDVANNLVVMTYKDEVAGNVRAEVSRLGVDQHELAKVLGMSQGQVSSRLRGSVEFRPSELEKIANFMQLDVEVFTTRSNRKPIHR